MGYWKFDGTVAETRRQDGFHAGRARGVQFGDYVGNKDYLGRGQQQFFGDSMVTARLDFVADGGVEVTMDIASQVARGSVGEEQLLRQRAARRVDANQSVPLAPARECGRNIVEDLAEQFSRLIAFLPDSPLNRFQRRRFTVAIHQPMNVGDRRFDQFARRLAFQLWRIEALRGVSGALGAELRHIRLDLGRIPVAAEIIHDARSRERKKRFEYEIYRRRRALDVQENNRRR